MREAQHSLENGDFESAAKELAGINTPEAKYDLAFLYKNGLGVNQDTLRSVTLMSEAAHAGYPLAETTMGLWYANGDGVVAVPEQAMEWYGKAAAQGDSNASALVAMAYATGTGEPEDMARAYEWFTVAEMQGNSYARGQQQQLAAILTDDERASAENDARILLIKFQNQGGGK